MKRTKLYPIFVMLAVLVLASLACSLLGGSGNNDNNAGNNNPGSNNADTNSGNATTDEDNSAVDQDEAAPTEDSSDSGSDDSGEDTGDLSDVESGLDALDSYRMTYTWSVDGKDSEGNAQTGSLEVLEEVDRTNNKQHMRYTSTGTAMGQMGEFGSFEVYTIDTMTYMVSSSDDEAPSCMGFSDGSQPDDFQSFDAGDMLGSVEDAKLIKKGEDVNGIKTDHYSFDESNIFFGAFSKAEGEYWVAQDGGYVVRYYGEAEGKVSPFGAELDGKMTWEYDLESINQDPGITLPTECEGQAPSTDIPIPANATEQSSFAGMITFSTPDDPATVAEFYKTELPNQGWTAGEDNSMDDLIMFSFTKDDRKLDFMITKEDGGGSSVVITETK